MEISIDFMKIESVAARDEALRLENISTKFVDIARCPRIISSYCKTTVKVSCLKFQSLHVICLPAVHAQSICEVDATVYSHIALPVSMYINASGMNRILSAACSA